MLYTVKQVAARWGVAAHTVYNLIASRSLSCVRIGRTVRLRQSDIEEYESRNAQPFAEPMMTEQAADLGRVIDQRRTRELGRKMHKR
jgi:excisionase family DNA binding protein